MSSSLHWIVTLVADEPAREWRDRYAGYLARAVADRDAAFAWWATVQGQDLFRRHGDKQTLTEIGVEFADMLITEVDDGLLDDNGLFDRVMWAADAAGADGRFHMSVRKGSPVTALHYALGLAGSACLPGGLGEFVLTAGQAAAALPRLERVLDVGGPVRDAMIRRAAQWLDEGGDGSADSPAECLDGPLRVFRKAVAEGRGVASATMWF